MTHRCDAAEFIGLTLIRKKCYLFNKWMNTLEALPKTTLRKLGN
ncbi:hypothetical protein [Candidatus Marithrix sp. Canyon 246]